MELLKCSVCDNIAGVTKDKGVPIMCYGKSMDELKANTIDGVLERHIPAAEITDGNLRVRIGFMEHLMLARHYITMILVEAGDNVMRGNLRPGEKSEGVFPLGDYERKVRVYEYCNLHSLRKTDIEA